MGLRDRKIIEAGLEGRARTNKSLGPADPNWDRTSDLEVTNQDTVPPIVYRDRKYALNPARAVADPASSADDHETLKALLTSLRDGGIIKK